MSRSALRCVSPEDLNVAPALLGLPLAGPGRRLAAMLLDLALIGMVSSLGNLWVLAGLAVLGLDHERALRGRAAAQRRPLWWAAGALLVVGGLVQGVLTSREAPRPSPRALAASAASAAASGVAAAPAGSAASAQADSVATARAVADAASAVRAAGGSLSKQAALVAAEAMAERVAALEEQLAEGCPPQPTGLQATLARWLDELGLGYGWALLYFSLLPAWWGGQTVGKRLLGLRVVELTGKPMTALRCLKRFGGYAAGMATGLFGFAQVLWDSNRQGIQDKTAHTVVIALGAPARGSVRDQG